MIKDFDYMILPLGASMFLNIVFSLFGLLDKPGVNLYILGVLMMYLSYILTYFVFIKPNLRKK